MINKQKQKTKKEKEKDKEKKKTRKSRTLIIFGRTPLRLKIVNKVALSISNVWYSSKSRLEGITSILIKMIGTIQLSWQFFRIVDLKQGPTQRSKFRYDVTCGTFDTQSNRKGLPISMDFSGTSSVEWLIDSGGWFGIFLGISSCSRTTRRSGRCPASQSRRRSCRCWQVEATRFEWTGGSSDSRRKNPTTTNTCRRFRVPESDLIVYKQ